jgi:hypothetical protein
MLLAIARTIYQWLYPGAPNALLTGGQIEGRPDISAGTVLAQAFVLWWAYICVFSRRSLAFYRTAAFSNSVSNDSYEAKET